MTELPCSRFAATLLVLSLLWIAAPRPVLAQTQETATVGPGTAAMTAVQASALLNRKAPGFSASREELEAFWSERLKAAQVMFDGDAAAEALPKVAAQEKDPEQRLKIYEDVAKGFSKKNQVNGQLRIREAILDDEMIMPGRRALIATSLARSWILANDYIRASRLLDTARRLYTKTSADEIATLAESIPLEIESNELILLSRRGETRKAGTQADVVDAIYRKLYQEASSQENRNKALGYWARYGWDYSRYLIFSNRAPQALAHSREVDRLMEGVKVSDYSRLTAKAALALSLGANGQYPQALSFAAEAVRICEQAKEPSTSNNCNLARLTRARILVALNRESEALPDVDFIRVARTQSLVIAGNFSETELDMLEFAAKGDWGNARSSAKRRFDIDARKFGTDHAFAKDRSSELMLVNLRDPAYVLTKSEAEGFLSSYLSGAGNSGDSGQRGLMFDRVAIEETLQRIVDKDGRLGTEDTSELAYAIAEYLRIGASQSALYDGAAKMAASNPELRALIEKEQALRAAQGTKRNDLASLVSQAERAGAAGVNDSQQEAIKNAQKLLAAEESRLKEARGEIARRFPVYQELSNPRIPTVKELAAKLQADEVYVSLYSGRAVGAVFVVTPDGRLALRKVASTADDTLALVKAFRTPFDSSRVPDAAGKWAGFDANLALRLYQSWLGVAAKELAPSQVLILAPGGALASVPWAATLTQKSMVLDDAKWLNLDKALVITPGASSVVLNRTLQTKVAEKPFIAFAAPQFSKVVLGEKAGAVRATVVRAADGSFDYGSVPPLPETLDEANAAAQSVGADPGKDVISGAAASRSRALAEKLDDRRFVEFATHGLLPGDLPGLSKPALAMAYEGRGTADSLLTTDDIVTLRLNAEWVLLSACNTGLVESGTGDTVSGMARAFFAAGAKSILATQWSVESESAKQLVVNTLAAFSSDAANGKAKALALAQRSMASGKQGDLYRHPYFWAPYFVLGEPQR